MSYLGYLAGQIGQPVEYAQETVLAPAVPEKNRRARVKVEWVEFEAFVSSPHRWGQQIGGGDYPKLMTNQIVVHTDLTLAAGSRLRFPAGEGGDTYRLTNNQRMPFMDGELWVYTCTSEVAHA